MSRIFNWLFYSIKWGLTYFSFLSYKMVLCSAVRKISFGEFQALFNLRVNKSYFLSYIETVSATYVETIILFVPYRVFRIIVFLISLPLYFIFWEYQKVIKANLMVAYPNRFPPNHKNKTHHSWDIKKLTTKNLFSSILNITEVARFLNVKANDLKNNTKVIDVQHIEKAYQKGNGALLFSAHYGNFIYPMLYLALVKKIKINFIIRKLDNPHIGFVTYNSFLDKGINTIIRGASAIRASLTALKNGEVVYLLMDQNVAIGGTFVPFYGRPASTFRGMYQLQKKTNCEVLGCNDYRVKNQYHHLSFYPAIPPQKDEDQLILKVNQQIETFINRDPSQHLWIHPRWKKQPDGVTNPYQTVKNLASK